MRIILLVGVLFGLLAISFLLWSEGLEEWIATDKGLVWLREQGPLAGLAGAALIASDLFLPMPASGVTASLGTIYGGFVGGLYASAGNIAAGLVAYGTARAMGTRAATFLAGEEELGRLDRFFRRGGAWAIAVTRVLPVFPEILCCLAGLAPMPFGRFLLALVCGSVPLSFLFSYYAATSELEPMTTILVAIAIPAVLFAPAWWLVGRLTRETPGESGA